MDDTLLFDARDHYWIVDGDDRAWSSAARAFVALDNADYLAWQASGLRAVTTIRNAVELQDVLLRLVPTKALERTFTPAELIAAFDIIDHGQTAQVFSADEIAGTTPVAADDARLSILAAEINLLIGTVAA